MDSAVQEEDSNRRPSHSAKDRPVRAPLGPRIRARAKTSADFASTPDSNLDSPPTSSRTSPAFCTTPLSDHERPSTSLEPSLLPVAPSMASLPPPDDGSPSPLIHATDVAAQVPPSPLSPQPNAIPLPSQSNPTHPSTPPKSSTGTFVPPPSLPPPPYISFESIPVPWKGLPLDVAQWTFTSSELQDIVSRAIRLSAQESLIRLLSPQALDNDIAKEDKRLDNDRMTAQAKWRFEAGRRTMLMHALNATTAMLASTNEGDKDDGLSDLISQLATTIASCDTQMSAIFHIMDQQTQLSSLQHRHSSSALSIALRKLNKTCERQADELRSALSRIETLEDELEEAWREAETVAAELDAVRARAVVNDDDIKSDDQSEEAGDRQQFDDDNTRALEDMTVTSDIAEVVGVTATAVASRATLLSPISPGFDTGKSDTRSIKSSKSAKSSRSRHSARENQSRLSRVSAARVRSRTASNASLRLPRNLRATPSGATSFTNPPPIPALPDSLPGHSFLDMDMDMGNVSNEFVRPLRKWLPIPHPEPQAALPDVPSSNKLSQPGRTLPVRFPVFSGPPSRSQSNLFQSINRSYHNPRRTSHVTSLSNSDPCPCSPVLTSELQTNRPGSASPRLVHEGSLVKKASSIFRRLSRATGSQHRSSNLLSTFKVKEEDEESVERPNFGPYVS